MTKHLLYHLLLLCCVVAYISACNNPDSSTRKGSATPPATPDSLEALQEEHQRKSNTPGTDTMSFATAFSHFFDALQASDTLTLQHYIDPENGLWVIEQPGAMPKMTHVQDLKTFRREYQQRSFFTIKTELPTCELQQEPFPNFDCAAMDQGRSGYTKDGCFASPDATAFQKTNIWDHASLTGTELRQVHATLPLLHHSVLHTQSSFRFHFGFSKGRWHLYFADLRIPCSA
ncbi:hypothetical protein FVR03_23915 [Pontibacter qinzhouensis]|uniref:Uncharacterized protein n=1 Tax=Pontibacter qinzhouensis TaxID=2603253 RepID=A0A5C8IJ45_9BACT|nr:hypothetical protein [Pontibacter qinzhouensis]TXK20946.1 hypothetical protein FVR03_23915 [Pontibacter qinzhouensis]